MTFWQFMAVMATLWGTYRRIDKGHEDWGVVAYGLASTAFAFMALLEFR